jgi:hypothetical protein
MEVRALGMEHLSPKRVREGALVVATSLGTLEDMIRKSPHSGISLHGGPFPSDRNLVCGGGASYAWDFDR